MKVWITKHALTQGIFEVEGNIFPTSEKMFFVPQTQKTCEAYYHKPYWHLTKEEAVKQAEKMRTDKLKSLEKQMSKIKSLRFI